MGNGIYHALRAQTPQQPRAQLVLDVELNAEPRNEARRGRRVAQLAVDVADRLDLLDQHPLPEAQRRQDGRDGDAQRGQQHEGADDQHVIRTDVRASPVTPTAIARRSLPAVTSEPSTPATVIVTDMMMAASSTQCRDDDRDRERGRPEKGDLDRMLS